GRPAGGRFRYPRRSTGTLRQNSRPLRDPLKKSSHGTINSMPYPEHFVEPMRLELTQLGVEELRTAADVDAAVRKTPGTLMIVVNSVCGCAAGKARPGVALALRHQTDRKSTRLNSSH